MTWTQGAWRWTWTWIRSRGLPGPSISFTSYNGQKVGCHNSDGQHQKCQGIARIFLLIYILTGVLPGVNLTNDFSEALVSKRYFCKVYRYHFLTLSDAGVQRLNHHLKHVWHFLTQSKEMSHQTMIYIAFVFSHFNTDVSGVKTPCRTYHKTIATCET